MLKNQAGPSVIGLDVPVPAGSAELAFLFERLQEAHGDAVSRFQCLTTCFSGQCDNGTQEGETNVWVTHSFVMGGGAVPCDVAVCSEGNVLAFCSL